MGAARRTMTVGGMAAAFALAVPAAAVAAPPEPFEIEGAERVEDDFCGEEGLTVRTSLTAEGRFRLQQRGPDGLLFFHEDARATTTLARVGEDGTTGPVVATAVDRTIEKDLQVTDNGNGTITVLVLSTGGSTLYDADGRAIARNPGQVRYSLRIDLATEEETFLGFDKESTGRTDDYCAALVPALLG
jgi:hypothetical protein